jgi:hypothetical protein
MPVKTWVGRFAIVDGQPQEESELLRSFPRQRADEDEDELYVLAEPVTPASREYCGQLVDALGRMYRQDTLSLTGALQRALQTANRQLHSWNERTLREQRVYAGTSCLALRGRNAYLAQIGPAVAYHVRDGRFARVEPEPEARPPLGEIEPATPTFTRYELSPGDLVLIASPRIDQIVDQETLRAVLLRGADEALVELFRLAKGEREFSLVLLACVVEPEPEAPPPPPPAPFELPPHEVERAAAPFPETQPPVPGGRASFHDREAAGTAPPSGYTQPPVRLKGPDADVRYRRTTGTSLPAVPPLAIVAVLILAIIGLIAWFVIPSALEESRTERYASLIDDVRRALNDANATVDPGQKRELLRQADTKLLEAEGLRPGAPELGELRSQLEAALAALDAVVELTELELIVDLSEQVPGAISPKDLALGGGGAYLLDREESRVIAVALVGGNAQPFVLFQAGDLAGNEITGLPRHIAWAEDLRALLVMDDARRLIALTPPGEAGELLAVRDAAAWGSADGIAYLDGNLYVLDRANDQVWRYLPGEGGFDSEREPLVSSLDLEQVVELAVGDALYLVLTDGSIKRVQNRQEQPFTQSGIDVPLSAPRSVIPLPESGRVLVADPGNNRIVVFAPDGTFLEQWRSASLSDLRAIAVDEVGGLLYVLSGGSLYRSPLPPPP